MNITLIPLLIAAMMLATIDSESDMAEVILDGSHEVTANSGALIVGDAEVTVPAGVEIPGPVYVIGGELRLSGAVTSQVIQLAGTVLVEPGAAIGDELRLIGGTRTVSSDSSVGRTTTLDLAPASGSAAVGFVITAILTLLLAFVGYRLARSRRPLLENAGGAIVSHPLVSVTVGVLVALMALAATVFMMFTLILIPVALVALLAGMATIAYGLIVWGHLIGARLPIRRGDVGTGVGVVLTFAAAQLVALVPFVGDLTVLALALTSVGAIVITYYGIAPFRPASLPE